MTFTRQDLRKIYNQRHGLPPDSIEQVFLFNEFLAGAMEAGGLDELIPFTKEAPREGQRVRLKGLGDVVWKDSMLRTNEATHWMPLPPHWPTTDKTCQGQPMQATSPS